MKSRLLAGLFSFAGMAVGTGSIAFAAGEAIKGGEGNSWLVVAAVVFSGLSNLGAASILVKKYMAKVDKDSETIPQLTATLESINKTLNTYGASIQELFTSRNEHQDQLTGINTIHKLRGCDSVVGTKGGGA